LPAAQLGREKIKEGFAGRADTPGIANMFVKVRRALFKYAIKEGYRTGSAARQTRSWR
jgi:hypothetical protein